MTVPTNEAPLEKQPWMLLGSQLVCWSSAFSAVGSRWARDSVNSSVLVSEDIKTRDIKERLCYTFYFGVCWNFNIDQRFLV